MRGDGCGAGTDVCEDSNWVIRDSNCWTLRCKRRIVRMDLACCSIKNTISGLKFDDLGAMIGLV